MSLELVRGVGPWLRLPSAPPPSRRRFGVPVGGPFDRESFEVAVALANASEGWELAVGTFTFVATGSVSVGVAGSVGSLGVDSQQRVPGRFHLDMGQVLTVAVGGGARAYVAAGAPGERDLALDQPKRSHCLRVIETTEHPFDWTPMTVSPQSDRTGIRLLGGKKAHTIEKPSEPMVPGAIQWTPDGTLIALGPDGPTIGGYPVVGVVSSADLDVLGQLLPGDVVSLEPISLEASRRASLDHAVAVQRRIAELKIARHP